MANSLDRMGHLFPNIRLTVCVGWMSLSPPFTPAKIETALIVGTSQNPGISAPSDNGLNADLENGMRSKRLRLSPCAHRKGNCFAKIGSTNQEDGISIPITISSVEKQNLVNGHSCAKWPTLGLGDWIIVYQVHPWGCVKLGSGLV